MSRIVVIYITILESCSKYIEILKFSQNVAFFYTNFIISATAYFSFMNLSRVIGKSIVFKLLINFQNLINNFKKIILRFKKIIYLKIYFFFFCTHKMFFSYALYKVVTLFFKSLIPSVGYLLNI